VLVLWKGSSSSEVTWEFLEDLYRRFPHFTLEYKGVDTGEASLQINFSEVEKEGESGQKDSNDQTVGCFGLKTQRFD
jgi:hypothetical protein